MNEELSDSSLSHLERLRRQYSIGGLREQFVDTNPSGSHQPPISQEEKAQITCFLLSIEVHRLLELYRDAKEENEYLVPKLEDLVKLIQQMKESHEQNPEIQEESSGEGTVLTTPPKEPLGDVLPSNILAPLNQAHQTTNQKEKHDQTPSHIVRFLLGLELERLAFNNGEFELKILELKQELQSRTQYRPSIIDNELGDLESRLHNLQEQNDQNEMTILNMSDKMNEIVAENVEFKKECFVLRETASQIKKEKNAHEEKYQKLSDDYEIGIQKYGQLLEELQRTKEQLEAAKGLRDNVDMTEGLHEAPKPDSVDEPQKELSERLSEGAFDMMEDTDDLNDVFKDMTVPDPLERSQRSERGLNLSGSNLPSAPQKSINRPSHEAALKLLHLEKEVEFLKQREKSLLEELNKEGKDRLSNSGRSLMVSRLDQENSNLKMINEKMGERLDVLQEDNQNTRLKNEELEEKLAECQNLLQIAIDTNEEGETQIGNLKRTIFELESNLRDREKRLDQNERIYKEDLVKMERQIEAFQTEKKQLDEKVGVLENENLDLVSKNLSLEEELLNLKEARLVLQTKPATASQLTETAKMTTNTQAVEVDFKSKSYIEMKQDLDTQKEKNQKALSQLATQIEAFQTEKKQLDEKVGVLENENLDLVSKNLSLEEELLNLKEARLVLQTKPATASQLTETAKMTTNTQAVEVDFKSKSYIEMKQDLDTQKEKNQKALSQLATQIEAFQTEKKQLDEKVGVLENENLDLVSKNLSLEEELLNLKEARLVLQTKPATASQLTETAKMTTNTQAVEVDFKSKSYIEMKQDLDTQKEKNQKALSQLATQIEAFQTEKKQLDEKVGVLENENLDLVSKNLSLEEELLNLKEARLVLQTKPATASQLTETAKMTTNTQAVEVDFKSKSYIEMKQDLDTQKEKNQKALSQLATQIEAFQTEKKQLDEKVGVLENENLDLVSKNLSLEEELLNLKEARLVLQTKPATASQLTETAKMTTNTQAVEVDFKSKSYIEMKHQLIEFKEQMTQDESSIENLSKLISQRDDEIDIISRKLESLEEEKLTSLSPKKLFPQTGRPILQMSSAQILLSQKESENEKLKDTVDQLASELDQQKERSSQVELRLELAAVENTELNKSIKIKEKQVLQVRSELESANQKMVQLNNNLNDVQKHCQNLQEKLTEKENQILVIKSTIKTQDDQIASNHLIIDHLRKEASKVDGLKTIVELNLRVEEFEKELKSATEALELSNKERLKEIQELNEQISQKENEIKGLKQQLEFERKKTFEKINAEKGFIKNIDTKSLEKDKLLEQLTLKNRQLSKELEENQQMILTSHLRTATEKPGTNIQRTNMHEPFLNFHQERQSPIISVQKFSSAQEPQQSGGSNNQQGHEISQSVELEFREQPNLKIVDESSSGPEFYKSPFAKPQASIERLTGTNHPGLFENRVSDGDSNRDVNKSYFSRLYAEGIKPEIGRSTIERVGSLYEKHMKILEETSSKFIRKPIGMLTLERVEMLEREISRLSASRERHKIKNIQLECILAARKPREENSVAAERLHNAKRQVSEQRKSLESALEESHQNWKKYLLAMQETEHLREVMQIPIEVIEDLVRSFADLQNSFPGQKLQFGSKAEQSRPGRNKGNVQSYKSEGNQQVNPLEEYFTKRTPPLKNFTIDYASFNDSKGFQNDTYSRSKSDFLPPKKT